MTLKILYIGNFEPPFSTENDLRRTMLDMGVNVFPLQEGEPLYLDLGFAPDMVLWTSTRDLREKVPDEEWRRFQITCRRAGIPVVGFHLDRWWGLGREPIVYTSPFFRCSTLYTADGGHQDWWKAAGVNHVWSPPAIGKHNCVIGNVREEFRSEIAFVGSWQDYGHQEWTHRGELVQFLRRSFPGKVRFWPEPGQHAVHGQDLADLYASVDIVVGDSCLAPNRNGGVMTDYCSDRVFETIGRGGVLVHPHVEGVTDTLVWNRSHLRAWPLGDWDALGTILAELLSDPAQCNALRHDGHKHVKANHTYHNRLAKVFNEVIGQTWDMEPLFEVTRA